MLPVDPSAVSGALSSTTPTNIDGIGLDIENQHLTQSWNTLNNGPGNLSYDSETNLFTYTENGQSRTFESFSEFQEFYNAGGFNQQLDVGGGDRDPLTEAMEHIWQTIGGLPG